MITLHANCKKYIKTRVSMLTPVMESDMLLGSGKERDIQEVYDYAYLVMAYMKELEVDSRIVEDPKHPKHLRLFFRHKKVPRMLKCLQN